MLVAADARGASAARIAAITAYSVVGITLVVSRFVGLDHGFWTDEVVTARDVVSRGPRTILAGEAVNHELFSLLTWGTTSILGQTEFVYRLWSVMPFLAGVVVVAAWLHARVSALSAVLFAYLATASPLLLDITRGARGYGLAFLAMAGLMTAAIEARRTLRTATVVIACVAGVVGTLTLPQFGIAFLATGAVLLLERELRVRVLVTWGVASAVVCAFYLPQLVRIHGAAHVEDGIKIDPIWVVTAPIDLVLIPALIWIDGIVLVPGAVWVPVVLAVVLVVITSPLARDPHILMILGSGVLLTIVALFATQAYVVPRYASFLLVPLFILVATGMATSFTSALDRRALIAAFASIVLLALVSFRFATIAPDVLRYPREAHRGAASAIERHAAQGVEVLAYMHNPSDLVYYLGRPVRELRESEVAAAVCESDDEVAYVMQPFAITPVNVPCLTRPGVDHFRFSQYARGDEMNVWLVPPPS